MHLIQQPNIAEREILSGLNMLIFHSLESLKNPTVCVCVGVCVRTVWCRRTATWSTVNHSLVHCWWSGRRAAVKKTPVMYEGSVAGSWTEDWAAGEGDPGRGPGWRWDQCCGWGLSVTAALASLFGVLLRMSRLRRLEEMTSAMNLVHSAQTSRSVQPWAYRWGNSSSTERRDKMCKGLQDNREGWNVTPA